jgi:PAS domain S-box-containing protein
MHATPSGMIAIDTLGIIIAANETATQVCGYQIAELTGQHLSMLVPGRYRNQHEKLFANFLDCPEQRRMGTGRDFEIAHKSGRLVPVEIGLEPCLIDGSLITLATIIDISERRTTERYKRDVARACGRLDGFESVGLPAAMVDSDGTILARNRYFEQAKDLVLDGIAAVVQKRFLKILKNAYESGRPQGVQITVGGDNRSNVVLIIPTRYETVQSEPSPALMVIHSSRQIESIGSELLKQVFEFTTAEAKVAACLARGVRVTEIASQLNVSRETIRTELSHIFSKTGLSSQIELVTLLAPFVRE